MWIGLLLVLGCGSSCEVEGALDYDQDANWLCRVGLNRACPASLATRTFATDGTLSEGSIEADPSAPVACFVVYPTLDLRLGTGLHHKTDKVDRPARWVQTVAGPLADVCTVYAPVYRQVRIGTYLGKPTDHKEQCFDSAYGDVLAAFEAFLVAEPGRPFVVVGHSQGAQHLSRLVRERIETDPAVLERMVAAYPIGWSLGTDSGGLTGGSFQTVPVCSAADQTGCVVGFRSFLEGEERPEVRDFREGEQEVCVNPGSPDATQDKALLSAFSLDASSPLFDAPDTIPEDAIVRWEGAFEAQCTGDPGDRALSVRWVRPDEPPVNLSAGALRGSNGTHILDMALGIVDIHDDIARRTESWIDAG